MIELPEAIVLAEQLNEVLEGRVVGEVIANHSPHKFAWLSGDSEEYNRVLQGQRFVQARPVASFVEIEFEKGKVYYTEGIKAKFLTVEEKLPKKHQLLIEFEDGSKLMASVQMYGGMLLSDGVLDNEYYQLAKSKPTPYEETFTYEYFCSVVKDDMLLNKSAKEVLATKQRIPGLGNGVLQDILFDAGIHPKRKMKTLAEEDYQKLYKSTLSVLNHMAAKGGRDTEKDLFGHVGGYKTKMCKHTLGKPCEICGTPIEKKAYMGGSVYLCPECQPEIK